MSMLGVAGLVQVRYLGILLPLLFGLLGIHLFLLWRQVEKVGPGPFLTSVAGMLTVLLVRTYAADARWALTCGILLVFGGSLWQSLSPESARHKRR